MHDHEARETRVSSHPDAEQRGVLTDVVVPLAQTGITTVGATVGAIAVAKVAKGNGDKE